LPLAWLSRIRKNAWLPAGWGCSAGILEDEDALWIGSADRIRRGGKATGAAVCGAQAHVVGGSLGARGTEISDADNQQQRA